MTEVAAHLTDSVVPAVPMRQWVLSVPKRLRPHPHFHLAVTDTSIAQRRILRLYVQRGFLTEADADDMPGTRRRRVGRGTGGFSLDGSVRIAAHDRAGLERLVRGHRREALVAVRCASSPSSPIPAWCWKPEGDPAPGRDPFDQSVPEDDGTWSA